MISFKQFLHHNDGLLEGALESDSLESLISSMATIKKECAPFLRQADGKPVYRGMRLISGEGLGIRHFDHPTGRPPKDSGAEFNQIFNGGIEEAFNISRIRSRSVFATGNTTFAQAFGPVFYFFPKGHIRFLWSPKLRDSFDDQNIFWDNVCKFLNSQEVKERLIGSSPSTLKLFKHQAIGGTITDDPGVLDWFDFWISTKSILNSAVWNETFSKTLSEGSAYKMARAIINRSDSVDISHIDEIVEIVNYIWPLMYEAICMSFSELYSLKDLPTAIDSEHEIMFYETQGYYLISHDTFLHYFKQLDDDEIHKWESPYEWALSLGD